MSLWRTFRKALLDWVMQVWGTVWRVEVQPYWYDASQPRFLEEAVKYWKSFESCHDRIDNPCRLHNKVSGDTIMCDLQ